MKTVSFNATKGGTGKTTLSIIMLNALTASGYKCLAIDADMINHSLSFYYNTGIPFETIQAKNIFKVFAGESIADNVVPINDRLDLDAYQLGKITRAVVIEALSKTHGKDRQAIIADVQKIIKQYRSK